ncbi:MAG: ion channel [Candidatus Dormibacteria bacterium]
MLPWNVWRLAEATLGIGIVAATLFDLFQAVVVPRPAVGRWRPSQALTRVTWRSWRAIGLRFHRPRQREAFLGSFGPTALLILLGVWVVLLMCGFGLMLDAQRAGLRPQPQDLAASVYVAAEALVTLGYGDYVPVAGLSRALLIVEAATGLGVVAVVISLLFSLNSAFQRREAMVITLDAIAGAPPAAVTLLENSAQLELLPRLEHLFHEWQTWCAEVLDSHLAFPLLTYFRSSHDNESWISALGAVLDAATFAMTTIDGPRGEAVLLYRVGVHLVEDLAQFFGFAPSGNPGVERAEFIDAHSRLVGAGYSVRPVDVAWEQFAGKRSLYAESLNAIAQHLAIPPAQWIGDRGFVRHVRHD